jgi:hypothetical protein
VPKKVLPEGVVPIKDEDGKILGFEPREEDIDLEFSKGDKK